MSPLVAGVLQRLSVAAGGLDWKRAALDASVLRAALSARAAQARHRASLPDARVREQAFAAASASYSCELESAASDDASLRQTQVDGLRWSVPVPSAGDDTAIERYLGQQDFPYRAIVQTRELGIGGIMLDIGANNGRMSIPRVVLGDAVAAYCAEPEPRNYRCLVRNVVDNGLGGLVLPDRVAIGAENGTARMVIAASPGGHRVVDDGVETKRRIIEVPSVTLDSWCERLGIDVRQVSFVKIDAQGSEVPILRGAARLLARSFALWQIEIDLALLRARRFAVEDLFGLLGRHFAYWIDLNPRARGGRVRPVAALAEGLAYLQSGPSRTDVLVFNLREPSAAA